MAMAGMDPRTSLQHRPRDDQPDSGDNLVHLYGEAARAHNLIGALSYIRSSSNQAATTHYRSAFQFLLQQEDEHLGARNHHHEESSQLQAYIRGITQDHQAERNDITMVYASNENLPLPVHYPPAFSGLQNSPYFMDEQGDCFVLDGNLSAHQVADCPPTAEDLDCISSAIVMFNLSLCHYKIGRYEQSLELLDLAAQCLTGCEDEPWATTLGSAISDNLNFISEVYYIANEVPMANIIESLHSTHAPAA